MKRYEQYGLDDFAGSEELKDYIVSLRTGSAQQIVKILNI